MQESSPTYSKCKFCQSNSIQTRILMKSLCRRLKKYLPSIGKDCHSEYKKSEGNGFKQLIRILFPTLASQNEDCQHSSYSNFLAQKLSLSSKDLSQVSGHLCYSMAYSNYQLELIVAQIKNASESIVSKRVEIAGESGESSANVSQRRRKWEKRRLRNRQINQRQQQKSNNSIDVNASMILKPEVRSQMSVSSLSDNPLSHIGYYVHYPIFFHSNHHIH